MYSVLKSKKRSISHKKNITVTSSVFITNNHFILTFSDCSCILYSLNLSENQSENMLYQTQTLSIVINIKRISQGICVLVCKNMLGIYSFQFVQNTIQHTFKVELKQLIKSNFAQMISSQVDTGLMNTLGCSVTLHTFNNKCFIIQYFVYEDKKIVLDCYHYRSFNNNTKIQLQAYQKYGKGNQMIVHNWEVSTLEIDIQINGHYVVDPIHYTNAQLAIYKQSQVSNADWFLRVISPFAQAQAPVNPHNAISQTTQSKEVKIILPEDKFNQDTSIMQICQYVDNLFMIIVGSRSTGKLRAFSLHGLNLNTVGNVPQTLFSFHEIPSQNCTFLEENFIKMVCINAKEQIFYALTHKHQIVDGQLYLNGLVIGNLRNGKSIEKGYCTLRNIDFSPNNRYILDMPYEFDKVCPDRTLYHIRLLLSKSSLYMLLIENTEAINGLSERFKNIVIQML